MHASGQNLKVWETFLFSWLYNYQAYFWSIHWIWSQDLLQTFLLLVVCFVVVIRKSGCFFVSVHACVCLFVHMPVCVCIHNNNNNNRGFLECPSTTLGGSTGRFTITPTTHTHARTHAHTYTECWMRGRAGPWKIAQKQLLNRCVLRAAPKEEAESEWQSAWGRLFQTDGPA